MDTEQAEAVIRGWIGLDAPIIWCGILDGMYYVAHVDGELRIYSTSGELLWSRESRPSHTTMFGIDVEDVERWVEEALEAIDGMDL